MSRINTNIQSLISNRVFNANSSTLNRALTRLSTGLRINSGRDDPAGLIASETLRASKVALTAATDNARRADTIIAIAEGGLQEVSALLLELEDLVDRTANVAGLSNEEVRANQLQVDAVLNSLNRLANTTSFGGRKLLNGSLDFTTSATAAANITANVASIEINAARVPDNSFQDVIIEVVTGSEFAFISAYGGDEGGTATATGELSAAVTLQVTGNFGTDVITFASGATQTQIVTAVNARSELTGVSAILSNNTGGINAVIFSSTTFGSNGFVTVEVVNTTGTTGFNLNSSTSNANDTGVDGTITINGQSATVDGLNASVRSSVLDIDLVLTQTFGTTDSGSTSFAITGGGARFSIAPQAGLVAQETIGITSVSTGSLGDTVNGFLTTLQSGSANDLASQNFTSAQRIVRSAINQVASLRGRLGAFQRNTLQTAINSMLVTFENTSAAESAIRDADFAQETSALTRAQILVNSATSTLQIANAAPQNVLALLG